MGDDSEMVFSHIESVCVKVEIEWDLPLMRQLGKVKMLPRRGFFREMVVGFSRSTSC